MPIYQDDLPPGASAYSAGAAARTGAQPVPTVAAARATGLPTAALFQPAQPVPAPVNVPAQPQTALERITALGERATTGLQNLLGITPKQVQPTAAIDASSQMEKQLDDLQKRSTTTVFQMRAKAANAGSSY